MSDAKALPNIEHFEWWTERARLAAAIREAFGLMGVDLSGDRLDRIMASPAVRDAVIVAIYNSEQAKGTKAEALYYEIGQVFDLDNNSVRNIIYSKRHAKHSAIAV